MKKFIIGMLAIMFFLAVVYGIGYATNEFLPVFNKIKYSVSEFNVINIWAVGGQVILFMVLIGLTALSIFITGLHIYSLGEWLEKKFLTVLAK